MIHQMDIISNIENALHFIKQELRVRYEMTGTARRKEVYELPLDALREAVINAVIHRDYLQTGSHTVVEIFDDRIEISNPGGLPKGLTPAEFGKKAVRRNPLIASLLHRVDFVENMGTGINKIRTLLKAANAPEAVFEFGSFYTVRFPRPAKDVLDKSVSDVKNEQTQQVAQQVSHHVTQQVSLKVKKLVSILEGELTTAQLMEKLKLKDRVNFSRRYLEPAIDAELVSMTQPDSPRSPTQKYFLTQKGQGVKIEVTK